MSTKIYWSHFTELLSIKDNNKIKYYIRIVEEQNLGVRELREKIKNNEYERLDEGIKKKFIKDEEPEIVDEFTGEEEVLDFDDEDDDDEWNWSFKWEW